MNKNSFLLTKKNNIPLRLLIFYNIIVNLFHKTNDIVKMLANYSEVKILLDSKKEDIIYFLYFDRYNIHKILYNEEEIIYININENNRNLTYYFYLSLLIRENRDIINYSYSIEYIYDIINNYQKQINPNYVLKKIIVSKIIIEIIYNYRGLYNCKEEDESKLNIIEEENKDIINNNIKYLKEFDINYDENYVIEQKIDKIYIDIINSLFKKMKFIDKEYISKIFNQLELKSINLTEYMIEELLKILDINNDYIKKYMIMNIDDLFDNNKINFFFLLFKYLFKQNIFIYKFPLLYETRKTILKIINNNLEQFSYFNTTNEIINKIAYFLKRITDSDYYFNKYFKYVILPKLETVLKFYKNYLFESKKEDIILIENIIDKKKSYILDNNKYLEDYDIAQKMNKRFQIIEFLLNKKSSEKKTEELLSKFTDEWGKLENIINKKNFEDINNEDKNILKEYFNNYHNKDKIFKKDIEKLLLNNVNNNSTRNNSKSSEKNEERITINNKYEKMGDTNNVNIINNKEDENEEESIHKSNRIFLKSKFRSEYEEKYCYQSSINSNNINNNNSNEKEKYSIIEFLKIIENPNNNISEFTKELSNKMIVSYGTNKILNFYEYNDNDINKKCSNNNFKDEIDNIEEYKKDKDINQQDFLIIYTKKKINKIDLKNNNMSIIYTNEKNANFLCKINKNSFLLCQEKKLVILCSFQKGIGSTIEEILDGYYKNGIVIDETLIIATSNSVISGGKDIIIFYNTKNKKIKEIEGYSFILSHTCLYLMEINNNQVLLCACKKYKNTQKNGILLINNLKSIKFNNFEDKINIKFYDTNNFEVHCFCQISTLNNLNN